MAVVHAQLSAEMEVVWYQRVTSVAENKHMH